MSLKDSILEELHEIPADRLEELYQFVHALNPRPKSSEAKRKKIMSFAGAFSDMSNLAYADFVQHTKITRANLISRKAEYYSLIANL